MPEETTTTPSCICNNCGITIADGEETVTVNPNHTITRCSACEHDATYSECEHCGEEYPTDDLVSVANGDGVCPSCNDRHYFTCDDCSERFRNREAIGIGGNTICQGCYDDNYFTCTSCDETYHNDDYGEDGRCSGCCRNDEDESSLIHDYGYTVPARFLGKGPHYYGVELEVEATSDREDHAEVVLDRLNRGGVQFACLKNDGSLSSKGFEIVTVPASLDKQREHWPMLLDSVSGLKSFDTKTCGLHVHCSRKPLSTLTVAKIVVFVNKRENQGFMECIAGRPSGQWAAYKNKKHKDVMDEANAVRYEAVNLLNYSTIEFRIFKGTLKKASVFKAIEFCDALIHFCLPCSQSIKDASDLLKFIEYCKQHRKDYPHLWGFISAKWLGEECKESEAHGYAVVKGEQ